MGRTGAAVAVAAVLLCGACHYEASDDDTTAATGDGGASTVQTVRHLTDNLVAGGSAAEVCAAAVAEAAPDADAGATAVLDEGDFDAEAVRWVLCGNTDAATVLSVRTLNGETEWSVTDVPVDSPQHDGDALDVTIEDASRAWATADTLAGDDEVHTHAWTVDGGVTWFRIVQ